MLARGVVVAALLGVSTSSHAADFTFYQERYCSQCGNGTVMLRMTQALDGWHFAHFGFMRNSAQHEILIPHPLPSGPEAFGAHDLIVHEYALYGQPPRVVTVDAGRVSYDPARKSLTVELRTASGAWAGNGTYVHLGERP